ncbi:MAG TPA: hypothetical protein VMH85_20790 [Terriglobales bacterium]|nr:hypothetical protein [Terriglobales bacterium]
MLSLLDSMKQTHTQSVLGLRSALSSQHSNVAQLLQTELIHRQYLASGSRNGPLGFPISEVQFVSSSQAARNYRGGGIEIRGGKIHLLPQLQASIRLIGARCVRESDHDQLSPHDEPYFVISVDTGSGSPTVKKFGPFEGVDSGTEIGIGDLLIEKVAPNPMSIRVMAYENDDGDPDTTAKNIQDEVVKLSQEAAKLGAAAEAADGPGIGPAAGAGTVGAIAGGPIGALIAAGIVSALGLGDDFINQAVAVLFSRPDDVGTPATLGQFQDNDFNRKINVNGGEQGEYDLFFDVVVLNVPPPDVAGGNP